MDKNKSIQIEILSIGYLTYFACNFLYDFSIHGENSAYSL